ncbi:16S rRNA (guanine(966)-N(2))-methyltransferase RsmD [Psychrobacter sp. I-STPA10]|uniref:16S rRNA (guanine(966)-N(2))-methyltransferase RsmD n=1 Tax=Psychrobacter sp. I-STPA10 TaxID=2585769 RepID=UPI001E39C8D6|nr:16S rRNA (guanine(966)-N(2))-methyltransferase RsmD [Psychrobacter sp. I-STPA10]
MTSSYKSAHQKIKKSAFAKHRKQGIKPSSYKQNSSKTERSYKQQSSQVRIIGGRYKRHNLKFISADGLRPTPDRLKETIFNWLIPYIYDAKVLDTCAGSGALGFEALSRGAAQITLIETNAQQVQCLQQSATQLKLESNQYHIIHGEAQTLISNKQLINKQIIQTDSPSRFDLVFIDPPYALNLWQPILSALINAEYIDSTSLIYIEDTRPLQDTLAELFPLINIIKQTKVGQINASLIQLNQQS